VQRGADFTWLREQAKDEESKERINEIERDHHLVFDEGKIIRGKELFDVNLGDYKIWFRKGGAYSSIEIYTEIFKEDDHLLIPEFSGKDDEVVFDIGANEGYYTLKIKQNNPECKIVSIEPNPLAFEILEKNVKSNKLKNVILINKAVTAKPGKLSFEIVPEVTAIGARELKAQKRPWLREERIKTLIVDGTTLTQLCKKLNIERIDTLKMDVEGMEMEILENGKNCLGITRRIVMEFHSDQLRDKAKAFLADNGFNLVFEESRACGDLYFANSRSRIAVPLSR
jgi:FkbM family methyltransferase